MTTKTSESHADEATPGTAEARPDENLVAAALEGDRHALESLGLRHRQAALSVATGIVGQDKAEQTVKDALLLAQGALSSLRDRSKFRRWFLAITRWWALRARRKANPPASDIPALEGHLLETLSELSSTPRSSEAGDALLIAALENLPPDYGEVLRYHFLHGLPHKQIAEFLDVPVSTVKWRCFRAKEILRCSLSPEPACDAVCHDGCSRFPSSPIFQIAGAN